jgi:CSLREA domain-containing protein
MSGREGTDPHFRQAGGRVSWSGIAALAGCLALAAPALPAAAARRAGAPPVVTVSITPPDAVVTEGGEQVAFRVRRNTSGGDLAVRIAVGGSADPGKDYVILGASGFDAGGVTVVLHNGEEYADIKINAVDDIAAEADERITLTLRESADYATGPEGSSSSVTIPRNDFAVTTTGDEGEGSLRQALLNAIELEGPNTVTFDTTTGPFATKQAIVLSRDLPDLAGRLTIDGGIEGGLWKATGVTVSGGGRGRVFHVPPGAHVTIRSLTVADGRARNGGGIASAGELIVKGVTFVHNVARRAGGALLNQGGRVTVINSTFVENSARKSGGGLASREGTATVTNCTFSDNAAPVGGGLYSDGGLLMRNTIVANSRGASDCVSRGSFDAAGTHNLIEANDGCGEPISAADPKLVALGDYNGPVPTMPLGGGSLAINLGDNAAALDEDGGPLQWDQRGNGDPRVVAGFTDIGAFETQAWPWLQVDTFEDSEWRACTAAGAGDCSLRGAILLANASGHPNVITFDPRVFAGPRTILLKAPLPGLATDMTLDARGTDAVTLRAAGRFRVVDILPGARVEFLNVLRDDTEAPEK